MPCGAVRCSMTTCTVPLWCSDVEVVAHQMSAPSLSDSASRPSPPCDGQVSGRLHPPHHALEKVARQLPMQCQQRAAPSSLVGKNPSHHRCPLPGFAKINQCGRVAGCPSQCDAQLNPAQHLLEAVEDAAAGAAEAVDTEGAGGAAAAAKLLQNRRQSGAHGSAARSRAPARG